MLKLKPSKYRGPQWINPRHVTAITVATRDGPHVVVDLVDGKSASVWFDDADQAGAEDYAAVLAEAIDRANGGQS